MNARMYIDQVWDEMGTENQIMGVGRKGMWAGGNGGGRLRNVLQGFSLIAIVPAFLSLSAVICYATCNLVTMVIVCFK